MWRLLLTSLAVIFLSACSVTIDPQIEEAQQSDKSSDEQNDLSISEKETENEETINTSFFDIINDVFQLDWSDRKEENAQPVFYLALGDSLTRGVGDETQDYGYTIRLQQELEKWPMVEEVELDNRGKNGRRSDQLLSLLKRGHYDEELEKANIVTITLGGNDVMKIVKKNLFSMKKSMFDKELPKFAKRYEQVIAEIRRVNPEVPIILVGFYNPFSIVVDEITPFDPIISEWNDEIEKLAATDENACFVSVEDLFVSNEDMVYHVDFFHPNSTGYDRMTKRIIESMQQCDIEQMSDGLLGFEE
ncbi:lysophospholipase L1 [Solibacillus silvestris StLB046]|uniref:Lysophospholipase L1 n=1 Tax=Solibacillus silvestris (strain StLB046) TaxID=1002809 RepID=F2F4U6_SOLSS|nr:GDSL-type esterase/lipase family protein [Solibacillus silvestris]BAK16511.1 lysophospholipase L1 [Solibacillus silvestris StLB046]